MLGGFELMAGEETQQIDPKQTLIYRMAKQMCEQLKAQNARTYNQPLEDAWNQAVELLQLHFEEVDNQYIISFTLDKSEVMHGF